jgi:hypothetical protein
MLGREGAFVCAFCSASRSGFLLLLFSRLLLRLVVSLGEKSLIGLLSLNESILESVGV